MTTSTMAPTTTTTTRTSSTHLLPTFAIAIGDRLTLWDPNIIDNNNDNNDNNEKQVIASVVVSDAETDIAATGADDDDDDDDAAAAKDTTPTTTNSSSSTITCISWNHNQNVVACCSTQQLPEAAPDDGGTTCRRRSCGSSNGIRSKIFLFSAQTCKMWGSIGMDKILLGGGGKQKEAQQQQQQPPQDHHNLINNSNRSSNTTSRQHHHHHHHCVSVRFSKNSVYLCVGTGTSSDSTIVIWNLKREVEARRFNLPPISVSTTTSSNSQQQQQQQQPPPNKSRADILQASSLDPFDRLVYGLGSRQLCVFGVKDATLVGHYQLLLSSSPTPTTTTPEGALSSRQQQQQQQQQQQTSAETFTCMDQVLVNGLQNLVVAGSSTGVVRIFDTTRCAHGEGMQLVAEWQVPSLSQSQSQSHNPIRGNTDAATTSATATTTTTTSSSSCCILQVSFCSQPAAAAAAANATMILLAILCRHAIYVTIYNFQSSACIQLLSTKSFTSFSSSASLQAAAAASPNATCCSWNGKLFAVGFDNGRVQVWTWKPAGNKNKKKSKSLHDATRGAAAAAAAAAEKEEEDCDWTLVAAFPSSTSSSSSLQPQQPVQGILLRNSTNNNNNNNNNTGSRKDSSTPSHHVKQTQMQPPPSLAVVSTKEPPTISAKAAATALPNNDATPAIATNDSSVQADHVVYPAVDNNWVAAMQAPESLLFSNQSAAPIQNRAATSRSAPSTTNLKASTSTNSIRPTPTAGVGTVNDTASARTNAIHSDTEAIVSSVITGLVRDEMDSLRLDMHTAIRNLHVDVLKQFQAQSDEMNRVMRQQAETLNQLALENRKLRAENQQQQLLLIQQQQQQAQQELERECHQEEEEQQQHALQNGDTNENHDCHQQRQFRKFPHSSSHE